MEDSSQVAAASNGRASLPVVFTTFVGRDLETQSLTQRIRQPSTRLLTLTGPGGSGKTRLALQVAAQLFAEFRDGIFLVDLSSLGDSTLVPSAMGSVLGIREASGQPILQRVRDHLRDKQLLLVVDNFEHLLSAAPLVSELLATCPDVKVLATSRTPLGLYGEHEFPVQPLPVPDLHRAQTSVEIAQVEAVQLFVERARATRPDFELTESSTASVAEICVRLDGLPLALELAAARVRLLTPAAILSRLERSLSLLTGGARDRPARQQTLRATIDWSYELLEPGEQRLFRQLGVFSGGFSLEAAEAVCDLGGRPAVDVLDALEAIGRASLVRPAEAADETRFEMLQTVREFSAERLEDSGEADQVRSRHADYFLSLAEMAEPLLHGPHQQQWLDRLARDQANLRGAFDWTLRDGGSEQGLRLAAALWWFWVIRGYLTEGRRWMDAAVVASRPISALVRARVLYSAGYLATFQGDLEQGRKWSEAGLALCRQLGEARGSAHALAGIGLAALLDGDAPGARAALDEGAQLFRTTADVWGLRTTLNGLGELERSLQNFEQAEALYTESLALARDERDAHGVGLLLVNLAMVALQRADPQRTDDLLRQAIEVWRDLGYRAGLVECVPVLASIAALRQQSELAVRLFAAWKALGENAGREEYELDRAGFEEHLRAARASLDTRAFDAAWAAGKELTLGQALAVDVAEEKPTGPAGVEAFSTRSLNADHEPLTEREWEVAQLVARGLTNRQIASELIVTEATAAKHVENIRAKLELTSRTQVATWLVARTARAQR